VPVFLQSSVPNALRDRQEARWNYKIAIAAAFADWTGPVVSTEAAFTYAEVNATHEHNERARHAEDDRDGRSTQSQSCAREVRVPCAARGIEIEALSTTLVGDIDLGTAGSRRPRSPTRATS
jgi:hypothetical protein